MQLVLDTLDKKNTMEQPPSVNPHPFSLSHHLRYVYLSHLVARPAFRGWQEQNSEASLAWKRHDILLPTTPAVNQGNERSCHVRGVEPWA